MSENLTFKHALSQIKSTELKSMLKSYDSEAKVDPNVLKADLVSKLVSVVPQDEQEKIIYDVFNKPNSRYTAHFAEVKGEFDLSEDELKSKISTYNANSKFGEEEFVKSSKCELEFKDMTESETVVVFSNITRKPHFDVETMISNSVVYQQRVRILIKHSSKRVIVYTGDRDIYNDVLTSLTVAFGVPFVPLDANKTGISEMEKGSFSFDTVKFIDFIYNGLTTVGSLVQVNQVELESNNTSKQTQKVRVQGEMLLNDKSISRYLLLHSRSIVGIKGILEIELNGEDFDISFEIGIRNNRVKLGLKKENYTLEQLKIFFTLIEEVFYQNIAKPGLIDRVKTSDRLNEIRSAALRED